MSNDQCPPRLAIGHWVLVIHWSLVIGYWSLNEIPLLQHHRSVLSEQEPQNAPLRIVVLHYPADHLESTGPHRSGIRAVVGLSARRYRHGHRHADASGMDRCARPKSRT